MTDAGAVSIGPLVEADRAAAVALLADAFWDGPLDRAVVGGSPARRRRICRAGMRANLAAALGRADVRAARRGASLEGVLVAVPPGAHPLSPPPLGVQLRTLLLQGPSVAGRWREVYEALQIRRPREPRWHLSLLGVAPGRQGRGLGSAMLAAWLRDVDAAGESAWLETSRDETVRFYGRHGFQVREAFRILDVPVWLMARPSRGSNDSR